MCSRRSGLASFTRGCIFIFKSTLLAALLLCSIFAQNAFAADSPAAKKGEESDEILSGPYSEYGEFDSSEDEANDEKFFQFGRFFGLGLGLGVTQATGNAGRIYQGGFPTILARINYWFDFNFALQVDVENSKHNYDISPDGLTSVNLFRVLFDVKYYFDTRDLSAPITFVGPHLIAGGGFYQRTDNIGAGNADATLANSVQSENAFGFNFGGGFELTLKPKKTYLQIQSLVHLVQFSDQFDKKFVSSGIPDRTGPWLTATVSLVWTW
ncbi:MAG: hypothetical protein AB1540_04685 [Bdellovibrionota bacterium]